ncbi:MAG: pentapeptide repeat-containing protein [Pseudomonadota bacterium]
MPIGELVHTPSADIDPPPLGAGRLGRTIPIKLTVKTRLRLLTVVGEVNLAFGRAADGEALPPLWINLTCLSAAVSNAGRPVGAGKIDITGAHIAEIDLEGARGFSVAASKARVERRVWIDDAVMVAGADFSGATIGGEISAMGARFLNPGGQALRLDRATVGGGVFLLGATARGETNASGLETAGQFAAEGARFLNLGGDALRLDRAAVGGGVFLSGATARGETDASGLRCAGQFAAIGARFRNPGGMALRLDRATVGGSVFLRGATALGETDASGLQGAGQFSANGARFDNPTGNALRLDGAALGRQVFLRRRDGKPARFRGLLDASAIKCAEVLAEGAEFDRADFDGAVIDVDAWFDGAAFRGPVSFDNARIGATLRLTDIKVSDGVTVSLKRARIDGTLETKFILRDKRAWTLDLTGAHADTIVDEADVPQPTSKEPLPADHPWLDVTGWPERVLFDRFTYRALRVADVDPDPVLVGRFVLPAPKREPFERRRLWLMREYADNPDGQPKKGQFRPQPFEQLAKVLREQGYNYAATRIAVEKRNLERRCADRGVVRLLSWIVGVTSEYGYSPARALACFFGYVMFGGLTVLTFDAGASPSIVEGRFTQAVAPSGENFEPFVYALDLATPLVDFGQASSYRLKPFCPAGWPALPLLPEPIKERAWCGVAEWAQALYSIVGYVLFSILVLTLTGVLRRD